MGARNGLSQFKYYIFGGGHSAYLGAALWGNPHELGLVPKTTNFYVYLWLSESAVGYANLGWGGGWHRYVLRFWAFMLYRFRDACGSIS